MSSYIEFRNDDKQFISWKKESRSKGFILDLLSSPNKNYCYIHKSSCNEVFGIDEKVADNKFTGGSYIKIVSVNEAGIMDALVKYDLVAKREEPYFPNELVKRCAKCDPLGDKYKYQPKSQRAYEVFPIKHIFYQPKQKALKNLKNLILEMYFGITISELITDTSSVEVDFNRLNAHKSDRSSGIRGSLSLFIPMSMTSKWFEKSIVKMVRDKFVDTYQFIKLDEKGLPTRIEPYTQTDDYCNRYCLNKERAHLLTVYRNRINLIWTLFETFVATVSWVTTNNLELTLLFTGIVEFIKRARF